MKLKAHLDDLGIDVLTQKAKFYFNVVKVCQLNLTSLGEYQITGIFKEVNEMPDLFFSRNWQTTDF
jgi:hypothetical protein